MYVASPPRFSEIAKRVDLDRLGVILQEMEGEPPPADYLHWDKLRHRTPPGSLTHDEWWWWTKLSRFSLARPLPLADADGAAFTYSMPDVVLRGLHFVDQRCSGEIAMHEVVTADDQARKHYLVNSLMEEAIRSSQLEGATTSRRVAKEMLRTGRAPRDRSEQMILNNYRGLQFIRDGIGQELTPEKVLALQGILAEGTLDNPDAAGRLQGPDDERIAVVDPQDDTVLHRPPPADQLPARLQAMCTFANESDDETFVHPVIRSILLHFWLAYDHPFEDGNGRTARALFYWSMRTHGYWLTEYLSISSILRRAHAQYTRSFLYTETDERDTTYFIVYQLDVILRAVEELHRYLRRKMKEIREVEQLIKAANRFNHRQLALLGNAIRKSDQTYTFRSHAKSHNVTHETARTDLLQLERQGLIDRQTVRGRYVFTPAADLSRKLRVLR
jgi:Fic family protein